MTKKLEDILNLPNVKEQFKEVDKKEKDKKLKETIKPILLIITSFIILQYAHLKNNDIIKPIKRISFIFYSDYFRDRNKC